MVSISSFFASHGWFGGKISEKGCASDVAGDYHSWAKWSGEIDYLVFVWLPNSDVAMARVAERVQRGGHNIPDVIVRRRYEAGLRNFFDLYRPIADNRRLYDNSRAGLPELIARGSLRVRNNSLWGELQEQWANGKSN